MKECNCINCDPIYYKGVKINTYVVLSPTNYGEFVYIVNEESEEKAYEIARYNGAWSESRVVKLDLTKKGILICGGDCG